MKKHVLDDTSLAGVGSSIVWVCVQGCDASKLVKHLSQKPSMLKEVALLC